MHNAMSPSNSNGIVIRSRCSGLIRKPSSKGMKLLLQPLIENAIYHGAKEKRHRAPLSSGTPIDEFISRISDNGTGMKAEQLAMKSNRRGRDGGVPCLKNVYKRLKLHHGDSVQFSIDSEWRVGTSTILILTFRRVMSTILTKGQIIVTDWEYVKK